MNNHNPKKTCNFTKQKNGQQLNLKAEVQTKANQVTF